MRLVAMMVGAISIPLNGLYNFRWRLVRNIFTFLNLQLGSDCSHLELRCIYVIDAIDGWRSSDVWPFVCGRRS